MTKPKPIWDSCTEKQRAVIDLLARTGWSNKQIAAALRITEQKVKARLRRVYDKTKLRNRVALTMAYRAERHALRGVERKQ
jgi:DNA-binding NarL/FixJ family response regulator